MASKKELEMRILYLENAIKEVTKSYTPPSLFGGRQFTLKGKVDAIIEHLGVQFEYKPATTERIVVVKKKEKK